MPDAHEMPASLFAKEVRDRVERWLEEEATNPLGAVNALSEKMLVEFLIRELGDSLREPITAWCREFKARMPRKS